MTRKCLRLCVVLLLFVGSQAAHARRIPTIPVQLSAADQREILHVLGVDSAQVFSIYGFRVMHTAGPTSGTSAMVEVAGEELATRIESGREIRCYKSESTWTCDLESSREMLYAGLPEECAEVVQSGGRRSVRMLRENGPSAQDALAIVELICTSVEMAEHAWSLGHRVISARRNADGELEVLTAAPDTHDAGLVFVLEERCDESACQLVIRERRGWIT